MKHLFSILTLALLMLTSSVVAQKDTLTVSQNSSTKQITIKSQKSGSLNVNPFEYSGQNNVLAVYSTAGADTMIQITRVATGAVLVRYRKTQYHFAFRQLGITAATALWLNTTYFNPVNRQNISVTTAVRDSLLLWSTVPVGSIIFNTTLDSPQIRVANTLNWRTF